MQKPVVQTALETPAMTRPPSFHHVGYVVGSIAEVGKDFARSLGAEWDGVIIHDPLQEARVTFMKRQPVRACTSRKDFLAARFKWAQDL